MISEIPCWPRRKPSLRENGQFEMLNFAGKKVFLRIRIKRIASGSSEKILKNKGCIFWSSHETLFNNFRYIVIITFGESLQNTP